MSGIIEAMARSPEGQRVLLLSPHSHFAAYAANPRKHATLTYSHAFHNSLRTYLSHLDSSFSARWYSRKWASLRALGVASSNVFSGPADSKDQSPPVASSCDLIWEEWRIHPTPIFTPSHSANPFRGLFHSCPGLQKLRLR
jgi:hypothetical protein